MLQALRQMALLLQPLSLSPPMAHSQRRSTVEPLLLMAHNQHPPTVAHRLQPMVHSPRRQRPQPRPNR
jgi:hypothetical protein